MFGRDMAATVDDADFLYDVLADRLVDLGVRVLAPVCARRSETCMAPSTFVIAGTGSSSDGHTSHRA